jgi:hypothetical protein
LLAQGRVISRFSFWVVVLRTWLGFQHLPSGEKKRAGLKITNFSLYTHPKDCYSFSINDPRKAMGRAELCPAKAN